MALAFEGGIWTIFSPVLITVLITRVSGVAMLERHLLAAKPGYRDYAKRTSALIPWFPKDLPRVNRGLKAKKKGRLKHP